VRGERRARARALVCVCGCVCACLCEREPPPLSTHSTMRDVNIPLSTLDLVQACRSHPRLGRIHFGTFSMDNLPQCKTFKKPLHLIVNTDGSGQPGQHWLGVYCSHHGDVEVMDSLASGPPYDPRLARFIRQFGGKITHNTHALQDTSSVACGLFCLSHAHYRAMGLSFGTWLARFDALDLHGNTRLVQCDFVTLFANRSALSPTLPRQTWLMWVALCRKGADARQSPWTSRAVRR